MELNRKLKSLEIMKKFDHATKAQYEAKYASIANLATTLKIEIDTKRVKQMFMPALEVYENELTSQLPLARIDQVRAQVKAGIVSPTIIAANIGAHPSYVWRLTKQVIAENTPRKRKSRKSTTVKA